MHLKKLWKILGHVIAIGLALTLVSSCNAEAAEMNYDTPQEGYYETMK